MVRRPPRFKRRLRYVRHRADFVVVGEGGCTRECADLSLISMHSDEIEARIEPFDAVALDVLGYSSSLGSGRFAHKWEALTYGWRSFT